MVDDFSNVEDLKAQEIWGLRLLDVERLNAMFALRERCGDGLLYRDVDIWIGEYLEIMRVRNESLGVRHEVLSLSVEPDHTVEREHLGRVALIDVVAAGVYGEDWQVFEMPGVVKESCYKADFKEWLETRLQGWYIERFGYDEQDVEFLTRVREEIYGVEA